MTVLKHGELVETDRGAFRIEGVTFDGPIVYLRLVKSKEPILPAEKS